MTRAWSESIVWITGASRGIGRALALELCARGATVWGCARAEEGLAALAEAAGAEAKLRTRALDITDAAAVADMAAAIDAAHGRLDVLVNNASILGPKGPLHTLDPDAWKQTLDVNANGAFYATRAAWPLLTRGDMATILNVSSSVGRAARAEWGSYCASKFALEALTGISAQEGAAVGIRALSVNPGGTATDMRAEAYPDEDPDTLPTAAQVAATFVHLLDDPPTDTIEHTSRDLFGHL